MNYLQEVWGVYPVGLKKVDTIGNVSLQSSQSLVKKLIKALKDQVPNISDSISGLIKNQIIMPVFVSKGTVSLFIHKLFAEPIDKGIVGFYEPEKNKIYIILDNNANFLSWASNKQLSEVVIHEIMHYAMQNYEKTAFNKFEDELNKYYKNFFLHFDKNVKEKQISEFIKYLLDIIEMNEKFEGKINKKEYKQKLEKVIDEEDANLITNTVSKYLENSNKFIREVQSNGESKEVVIALLKSYVDSFELKPETLAIQELLFPSEVICILSSRMRRKHYDLISYMAKKVS